MKQTKRYKISKCAFTLDDLRRIASVFDEQSGLAKKSDHHYSVSYCLYFSDETTIESDSLDIFEDPYLSIKRVLKVDFRFLNYKLSRSVDFSVSHGNGSYGNEFVVTSEEQKWGNDVYLRTLEYIKGAKPQSSWLIKYSTLIYNLMAIGVGSLGMLIMNLAVLITMPDEITISDSAKNNFKAVVDVVEVFSQFKIFYFIMGWLWTWSCGWVWGAPALTSWILSAWPNIELDLGAEHLKMEKTRRRRMGLLLTVIIIPTALSIALSYIKNKI